jgi:glutathione-specific gamma-glutamylcyclotransferase
MDANVSGTLRRNSLCGRRGLDSMAGAGDFWIFGYGSLMWRPGFAYVERRLARARGYHRRLCIYSHVHRGTKESPGLVLGLDRGGSCTGVVFRVAAADRDETIAYLRARELVTSVYLERWISVSIDNEPAPAKALAYIVDRRHAQYCGRLPREASLELIRQGVGVSGRNPEYVRETFLHLRELGVRDHDLAWFAERLADAADHTVIGPVRPVADLVIDS